MCTNCALESFKAGASGGGAVGLQAILATGLASIGMRSASNWLIAREVRWLTPRIATVITTLAVCAALAIVMIRSWSGPPPL